jgi:RimJ/RimL family protein N-acetyltransferase
VFDDNPRAIRVYERLGFVHEGRKREADFRDGKYRDKVMMSLLEGELRADP